MESLLGPLIPLFERERAAGRPVALGLLVETAGSTYRKAGALMLIAADGQSAGLLSGGCLEGDLGEYARQVISTGQPRLLTYDMRGGDDLIWGLGLGCEGAMHILLMRVGPENGWQPLMFFSERMARNERAAAGVVIRSNRAESPVGTIILEDARQDRQVRGARIETGRVEAEPIAGGRSDVGRSESERTAAALADARRTGHTGWLESPDGGWKVFVLPLSLPPKLLLLGAGPDASPVLDFAARLNWKVTLVDHRAAYADPSHFPAAERVLQTPAEDLQSALDLTHYVAAVVMSHHLPSDLKYLRVLARTDIPYLGLLGPAVRRERLLADLGPDAERIRKRLHAPVGLAIGGRSPESIALAIVAEIHAFLFAAEATGRGSEVPLHAAPALAAT